MGAASNTRVVAHDPPLSIRIRRVIDWIASHLKGVGYRSHFVVTALLAAAFIPALFVSRLPVKLDWAVLLNTYWIGFAFQAMFFATLLYVIQFPAKDTIGPLWSRCQHDKRRLLVLVPVLLFLFWFYVHFRFVVLFPLFAVVALAIVELVERTRTKVGAFTRAVSSVLLPAAYLFLGLILVSGYNDIAVASRPYVSLRRGLCPSGFLDLDGSQRARNCSSCPEIAAPWALQISGICLYLRHVSPSWRRADSDGVLLWKESCFSVCRRDSHGLLFGPGILLFLAQSRPLLPVCSAFFRVSFQPPNLFSTEAATAAG